MAGRQKIDFIGIGMHRSGTTWLSECLRQHPNILFPKRSKEPNAELDYLTTKEDKELDFFTTGLFFDNGEGKNLDNYGKGLGWYLAQFPEARSDQIRGEFSPSYMLDERAAGLIHDAFPDVKLLVMFRNPVDMAYSLYALREYAVRLKSMSFEEAVDRGLCIHNCLMSQRLKRYLELFPREHVHMELYDDVIKEPEVVVRRVYDFLGVRSDFVPTCLRKKINARRQTKSPLLKRLANRMLIQLRKSGLQKIADGFTSSRMLHRLYCRLNLRQAATPSIKPETRQRLKEFYRADILELQKLIGRDLGAWL